ncbi:MAG: hypothetical protein ACR2J8_01330 [Thermomicrobiales bacterium]
MATAFAGASPTEDFTVIWVSIAAGVLLLNVVPAFMPPTWALLAWAHMQLGLPVVPLALVGAVASMIGRVLLALGSRQFGERCVPRRWEDNLHALAEELEEHQTVGWPLLALFMLGPVPTNHLFIAAGMSGMPLAGLAAIFGFTRFVSYLLWIGASAVVAGSLESVLSPGAGGWMAAAVQLAGIAALIAVMQVNWAGVFRRSTGRVGRSVDGDDAIAGGGETLGPE